MKDETLGVGCQLRRALRARCAHSLRPRVDCRSTWSLFLAAYYNWKI